MENALERNFGPKKSRGRENRRVKRDKKISAQIRNLKSRSISRHESASVPLEPLSPYVGVSVQPGENNRTVFPMRKQPDGKPLPQYKDLSRWLKFDLLTMVMYEYGFVTYNAHIHPKLEREWIDKGKDPRTEMGVRVRKELRKLNSCPGDGWEFAFVVEGWAKQNYLSKDWSNPKPVGLHIHGCAALYDPLDIANIKEAINRACGHGLRGYTKMNPKIQIRRFKREGPTYTNYAFKYSRRKDHRLGYRRDFLSNTGTALAEEFWKIISGHYEEFSNPPTIH